MNLWWYDYLQPVQPTSWISPVSAPPTTCAGAVHVFPCPHCRRCVCGAATLTAKEPAHG